MKKILSVIILFLISWTLFAVEPYIVSEKDFTKIYLADETETVFFSVYVENKEHGMTYFYLYAPDNFLGNPYNTYIVAMTYKQNISNPKIWYGAMNMQNDVHLGVLDMTNEEFLDGFFEIANSGSDEIIIGISYAKNDSELYVFHDFKKFVTIFRRVLN